jgi:hypothetical protein
VVEVVVLVVTEPHQVLLFPQGVQLQLLLAVEVLQLHHLPLTAMILFSPLLQQQEEVLEHKDNLLVPMGQMAVVVVLVHTLELLVQATHLQQALHKAIMEE